MGADGSKVPIERMPPYYSENPKISQRNCGILLRSLHSILGARRQNGETPFTQFYEQFYSRLDEVKEPDHCVTTHIGTNMHAKSFFLVKLVKIVVLLPQKASQRKNKSITIDSTGKRELKKFVAEYSNVKLECFGPIGNALFDAASVADEMYTQWARFAWIDAYSLLLRHIIPIFARVQKRKNLAKELDLSSDAYTSSEDSPFSTPYVSSDESETPTLSVPSQGGTRRRSLEKLVAEKLIRNKSGDRNQAVRVPSGFSGPRNPSKIARKHLCDIVYKSSPRSWKIQRPNYVRRHSLPGAENGHNVVFYDEKSKNSVLPGKARVPRIAQVQCVGRQRSHSTDPRERSLDSDANKAHSQKFQTWGPRKLRQMGKQQQKIKQQLKPVRRKPRSYKRQKQPKIVRRMSAPAVLCTSGMGEEQE